MAVERTLSIIKPDATRRNLTGKINARFEEAGLRIVAQKRIRLTKEQAEKFYEVHAERSFFGELVDFITGGPLVAMVVEGPNAVAGTRRLMGVTNPVESTPGSIRGDYALEIGQNLVHGSDSPESAEREIALWFPGLA